MIAVIMTVMVTVMMMVFRKPPPPPPDVLQVLQLCLICNVADTWMVDRGYQEFLNNDFDINEGASWSDCGEPGEMPTLPPDVWV
jgi:hypothetical protein